MEVNSSLAWSEANKVAFLCWNMPFLYVVFFDWLNNFFFPCISCLLPRCGGSLSGLVSPRVGRPLRPSTLYNNQISQTAQLSRLHLHIHGRAGQTTPFNDKDPHVSRHFTANSLTWLHLIYPTFHLHWEDLMKHCRSSDSRHWLCFFQFLLAGTK